MEQELRVWDKGDMTLKGRQNHYNVKFLSGYGLSVSLKDNKIILKNGTYPYSDIQEQEEWFITQLPYEKIVISGKGYLSTDALALLNENNRNVLIESIKNKIKNCLFKKLGLGGQFNL